MPPARRPSRARLVAVILLVLTAAGGVVYLRWPRPGDPVPAADREAAYAANARGVGRMEQFQYAPAAELFAEAERLAPDWTAAKVNRGIALYNLGGGSSDPADKSSNFDRALAIFAAVPPADPVYVYARYNAGVIRLNQNATAEALADFTKVTDLDPADAHAWMLRGKCTPDAYEAAEAKTCYETALKLNPYLNGARYPLAQHALTPDADRAKLLADFSALAAAHGDIEYSEIYSGLGRYANVIGSPRRPAAGSARCRCSTRPGSKSPRAPPGRPPPDSAPGRPGTCGGPSGRGSAGPSSGSTTTGTAGRTCCCCPPPSGPGKSPTCFCTTTAAGSPTCRLRRG